MASARAVDGILLLDKPAGPSSNQVLQWVKRLFEAKKAGHAGTLDPLATGLLPILFGEATKFASHLSDATKCYEATVLLGVTTSTGDLAGEIIERIAADISADAIDAAVSRFRGALSQIPPMHSAIKRGGVPLYRLARQGEVVIRVPRNVFIEELTVLRAASDEIALRVVCSKGTYIRVLAEDIGKTLGCGATLKSLRRMAVGGFDVHAAVTLDTLEGMAPPGRSHALQPIDGGLKHIPSLHLSGPQCARLRMGQVVDLEAPASRSAGTVRLYDAQSEDFLGLGDVASDTVRALRLVHGPTANSPALPDMAFSREMT